MVLGGADPVPAIIMYIWQVSEKPWEYNREMHVSFVDFEKYVIDLNEVNVANSGT